MLRRGSRKSKTSLGAISIRQPYAEQILQGKKAFECRSRLTRIRGRVYIYAALKEAVDVDEHDYALIGKDFASLPKGVNLVPQNQPQPGFWVPRFRGEA